MCLDELLFLIHFHTPDGDREICTKCLYCNGIIAKDGYSKIYISCNIINDLFGEKKYTVLLNDNDYFHFPTCKLFKLGGADADELDTSNRMYIIRGGDL
jgi:hypothetical protein